jgi:hypothetical protein
MRIFLGSSREASNTGLLRRIASWVEACGHTPLRWDEPGVFPPGAYTFPTLRRLAREVDGAIFVFSEDDTVWYRTDKATQPRDNILLEYGLFSATLGESHVAICRSGDPRTASDLLGITSIAVSQMTFVRAETQIAEWLKGLEAPDSGTIAMEQLSSPFQASGKRSLFLKGTELVRRAHIRVALVAKTPIILMGPRPYDGANRPISYEAEQYATYMALIEGCSGGNPPDFLCVASRPCVLEDLRTYRQTALPGRMRESYRNIHSRSAEVMPGSRIRFRWHHGAAPMTFLVCDDDFMIWFKDGSGESVWITAHDEVIARALFSHAEKIAEERRVDDALRDFDEPF